MTKRSDKDEVPESPPLWEEFKELLRRVPMASSVAFCMCFVGIIVFSACLFNAVEYLVKLFDLDVVSKIVWLVMVFHIAAACVFLLIGTLSTGNTRREVCAQSCTHCNLFGKLAQISAMGSAYFLHTVWLFLPALLLLPVGILAGINYVCPMVPACITLTDYGIPPEYIDKIQPEQWIAQLKTINSTDIEKYITQVEGIVDEAITSLEGSPMLEELLTKIENNIPSEEDVQKILDGLMEHVDSGPIVDFLDNVQGEVRKVDTDEVIDDVMVYVNETLKQLDKVTDTLEDAVDDFSETREKAFDEIEKGINNTLGDGSTDRRKRSVEQQLKIIHLENEVEAKFLHIKDSLTIAGGNVLRTLDNLYATQELLHSNLSTRYRELDANTIYHMYAIRNRTDHVVSKIMHEPTSPLTLNRQKRQEPVQEGADAAVDAVEEGLEKAGDAIDDVDVDAAIEKAGEEVEKAVEKISEEAEKLAEDAAELAKVAEEKVKEIAEEAKELAETAVEEGKKVAELTKEEIEKIVEDAKAMARQADVAARVAAKEAEMAVKKAEEAAKTALSNLDEQAAELAREGEVFAREAAKKAQKAADDALELAKGAAVEAERVIKAAAEGATATLLEAARNVRYYAKQAIKGARTATREAAKGARKAAKLFDVAKAEVIKGYEIAKMVAHKLGIHKKDRATFCSHAKVIFCEESEKAYHNMIFVFIASIVICKSMVHFLMAMSANWVHIRREEKEMQEQADKANEAVPDGANEKLVFNMNDQGSLEML